MNTLKIDDFYDYKGFYNTLALDYSGDYDSSYLYLEKVLNSGLQEKIIWKSMLLFTVAEHCRLSQSDKLIFDHRKIMEKVALEVADNWNEDNEDIMGMYEDQVNTTTLALCYGGLRYINNYLNNEIISKNLRDIQAFIYANNIKGDTLVNGKKHKSVTIDLVAVSVPFGLLEPESLVLIEALKKIDIMVFDNEELKIEDKSYEILLLAWYYFEKGSYDKCKTLLQFINSIESIEKYEEAILDIVSNKLKSLGHMGELVIKHEPFGNDNRYRPQNYERFPKIVTEDDKVIIKAITYPINQQQKTYIKYYTQDEYQIIEGTLNIEDEMYWSFEMGPFSSNELIKYEIIIKDEDEVINSELYSFEVYKKETICCVKKNKIEEKYIELIGSNSTGEIDLPIYIYLDNDGLDITMNKHLKEKGLLSFDLDTIVEQNNSFEISIGSYDLNIEYNPFSYKITKKEKVILETIEKPINVYICNNKISKLELSYKTTADERFYGFGERYNTLNQRGNLIDMYVFGQYKNQGIKTYMPIPFYMASNGYGVHLDTYNYSEVHLENENTYTIVVEDDIMDMKVFVGDYKEVLGRFINTTGKPALLPKWAFGPWMSSNNWDNQQEVLLQAKLTKEHNIPSTVLVIEAWSDEATYYIFNDAMYQPKKGNERFEYDDFRFPSWGRWPNPKEMIEELHDSNIKCILWQIPISKSVNGLHNIQKDKDEEYMIKNNYCVRNEDETPFRIPEDWFKDSLIMDFTDEDGKKWWFDKRKYLVQDLHIDGFKTDGGEFIFGRNLKFSDGSDGAKMRNKYINDYASSYYEFANSCDHEGITFSRAGYTGCQTFPAHWAGDEISTFAAFRRSIVAGLNAGLSGVVFWGWDLAGFSGEIPTAELFIRGTQMAAFCPIMQYHAESKAEFNQDRTPWNIAERNKDKRALEYYKYYAHIRMNILPYIYAEAKKCCQTGLPLMRALIFDYMDDENIYDITDQYLFGDNLLIAPIVEEGAENRNIYLPEGKWIDFFDGKEYKGKQYIDLEVPLNKIPVFVKKNSVIPLNLSDNLQLGEGMDNSTDYKNLCFKIYGTLKEEYIYEDDNVKVIIHPSKTGEYKYELEGIKDITIL